jgi:hypothetical protein
MYQQTKYAMYAFVCIYEYTRTVARLPPSGVISLQAASASASAYNRRGPAARGAVHRKSD